MFNNFFNFFDIMNNFGVASTSKLIKQPAILKWYFFIQLQASRTVDKLDKNHYRDQEPKVQNYRLETH